MIRIFKRSTWRHNPAWPGGWEPKSGRGRTVRYVETEAEARRICEDANATAPRDYPARYKFTWHEFEKE